jgi:hypothetical protein
MAGDGATEINLLSGDEEHKKKWSPVMERHVEALVFNTTTYARLIEAVFFRTSLAGRLQEATMLLKRGLRLLGLAPGWSELTREDQLIQSGGPTPPESVKIRPGMTVRVRDKREILLTLDSSGALGGIVFLPEMLRLCGRVLQAAEGAASAGEGDPSKDARKKAFVLCEASRDGTARTGLFPFLWREEWLEPVPEYSSDKGKAEAPAMEHGGACQTGPETAFGGTRFVGLPQLLRLARESEEEPTQARGQGH